jgi:hypothetical protein
MWDLYPENHAHPPIVAQIVSTEWRLIGKVETRTGHHFSADHDVVSYFPGSFFDFFII